MTVNENDIGGLLLSPEGFVFRVVSYCSEPTAILQCVNDLSRIGGSVHSNNVSEFTKVSELSFDQLKEVVARQSEMLEHLVHEKVNLKEQLADAKMAHATVADALADCKMEEQRRLYQRNCGAGGTDGDMT